MPILAYFQVRSLFPKPSGELKPVVWMGSSKRDLLSLSDDVQDVFGYAIDLAQRGQRHPDVRFMKGVLRGVMEVVTDSCTDTYRAMYTVELKGVVYVLHVFKKKSKSGRATPRENLETIAQRLKAAKQHYKAYR